MVCVTDNKLIICAMLTNYCILRYEEALVVWVISNRCHKRQPMRYYYWDKQMCNGTSTGNLVQ